MYVALLNVNWWCSKRKQTMYFVRKKALVSETQSRKPNNTVSLKRDVVQGTGSYPRGVIPRYGVL